MGCPYLEEVVMVFCRAYPIKKMIPRSRSTTCSPCQGDGFPRCPFYQEVTARMDTAAAAAMPACRAAREENGT